MHRDEVPRFVHVDWRIENNRFILNTNSPPGIPCQLRLPNGDTHNLPDGGAGEFDVCL